jgi:hypothetical protein
VIGFSICVNLRHLRMKVYPQITQMFADEADDPSAKPA